MANHLSKTELQVGTQSVTKIVTGILGDSDAIPTSKAVFDFINYLTQPTSLAVLGKWENPQHPSSPVDTTGLVTVATYGSGRMAIVNASVSPSTWSSTPGIQTAYFSYTENGVTVTATKTANVESGFIDLNQFRADTIMTTLTCLD